MKSLLLETGKGLLLLLLFISFNTFGFIAGVYYTLIISPVIFSQVLVPEAVAVISIIIAIAWGICMYYGNDTLVKYVHHRSE